MGICTCTVKAQYRGVMQLKDPFIQEAYVKHWLNHVRFIDAHIRSLEERQADIRQRLELTGVDPSAQNVSTGNSDKLSAGVATLLSLEQEWSESIKTYQKEYEYAYNLCTVEFTNRYIVWLRWVDGLRWNEIAKRTHYSVKTLHRREKLGFNELYPFVPYEMTDNVFPDALE